MAIIENNSTRYQIVTPGRRFPVENEAARILQQALLDITGVRVPVRWGDRKTSQIPSIRLGSSKVPIPGLWDRDTYEIRTKGKDLILVGRFRRGVHYAVSAFLESLGVSFYGPGMIHYPKLDTISLPKKDILSEAAFGYRHVFYPTAQEPEWALKWKLNVHNGKDERWGKNVLAHSWGHSFAGLVPVKKHFKDHPEYFSLVDGYRRNENSQLCCTNPEVADIVTENLGKWINANPEKKIFAVGQNDWLNWCECPECAAADDRENTQMGQVLTLVNRVAERFPDHIISTLAYSWSVEPPKDMRAADNALIVLCHNRGCFSHGLDKCKENAVFLDRLKRWKEKADNILIWDYYVNYRHYLLPTANFRRIANDFRLYRDLGISSMFCQGSACTGGQFEHLRQYIQSKLLWNPDLDVESLMIKWAEGVYGKKAAAYILEYLFLLEDRQEQEMIHRKRFSLNRTYELFTPEVLKKGKELWDKAEKEAETEKQRRKVFASRSAEMASRLIHTEGEYRAEGNKLKLFPPVDEMLRNRFVEAALAANVSYLREDIGTPEDFKNDFGRTYRAVVVESDILKMVILPEIGGRIYSVVLKKNEKELLAVPGIYESINCAPYSDGYDFSLEPQRLGKGAVEEYSIVSENKESAVLKTELPEGLEITSEFRLEGSKLHVCHTVENCSGDTVEIEPVCNPAWNRDLFGDDGSLEIKKEDDTRDSIPLNPDNRESRDVPFKGDDAPYGEWCFETGKGITIKAVFPEKNVSHTRMILIGSLIQLQHCFKKIQIAQGDSCSITSSWKFEEE